MVKIWKEYPRSVKNNAKIPRKYIKNMKKYCGLNKNTIEIWQKYENDTADSLKIM